jgi:hypothetical protein
VKESRKKLGLLRVNILKLEVRVVILCGVIFSCLPLDPRLAGSDPANGDKNPQHAFLRRGSKVISPIL